jgi:transcriptional regulator with XRE-family HTH domain
VIEAARTNRGLSTREAARRAGVSDTLWRSLERGYELRKGTRFDVSPRADTVAKVARIIGIDVTKALELAGLPTVDGDIEPEPDLSGISDEHLLDEVRRRMQLRDGRRALTWQETDAAPGQFVVGTEPEKEPPSATGPTRTVHRGQG